MPSNLNLTPFTTIYECFKQQLYTDVRFICHDGEIGAHLIVLKANCKWFRRNGNKLSVFLVNYVKKDVSDFLTLLYVGETTCEDIAMIKQLLDLFHCTWEEKQQKESSVMEVCNGREQTELPPAPSVSLPTHLLPNPFVRLQQRTQSSQTTDVLSKNKDPDLSPILIPAVTDRPNEKNRSQQITSPNSDSSDNSDILIIEDVHSVVEINDTLTQQQLPDKNEKKVSVLGDVSLVQRRQKRNKDDKKQNDDDKTLENDVITIDTDKDTAPLEVETRKRKKVNEAPNAVKCQKRKKNTSSDDSADEGQSNGKPSNKRHQLQLESDTDDSELNIQPKYIGSRSQLKSKTSTNFRRNRFKLVPSSDETSEEDVLDVRNIK